MDGLALNCHGRFLEGFGVGGVRVAGVGDVYGRCTKFHRLCGLRDHRARQRVDHPHAQHAVGLGIGDDLHKAIGVAVCLGAAAAFATASVVLCFIDYLCGEGAEY